MGEEKTGDEVKSLSVAKGEEEEREEGIKASEGIVFLWKMTGWWLLPQDWLEE